MEDIQNYLDEETYHHLIDIIEQGDANALIQLVQSFSDPAIQTDLGFNALHIAASYDAPWAIKPLVECGIPQETRTDHGDTALHIAATGHRKSGSTVFVLLDVGADPNVRDARGRTPLYRSIKSRSSNITEALIRAGAVVNTSDDFGITPLDMAIDYASQPEIALLLMRGADPNARIDGETNLHRLALGGLSVDYFELLIMGGADINAKTPDGRRPVDIAVSRGRADLLAILDPER